MPKFKETTRNDTPFGCSIHKAMIQVDHAITQVPDTSTADELRDIYNNLYTIWNSIRLAGTK